jgi:lysozyme
MSRPVLIVGLALLALFAGTPAARGELHVSPAGVQMIEDFEGYVPSPAPDPVGVATVCFGTTTADVSPLPRYATRAQCERLLIRSLDRRYLPVVRRLFGGPLRHLYTVARVDSLASAAYNLGAGFLACARGFSSMCAALAARDPHRIGAALLRYDHAAGTRLPGLTRRRQIEAAPWLHPIARFEDFPARERHLIVLLDRLAGHTSPAASVRRTRLQLAIRVQLRRLVHVARAQHDWLAHRRDIRQAALLRRLPHAHGGTA